ncbi:YceI family protein [Luteibacter sp. PPL554]
MRHLLSAIVLLLVVPLATAAELRIDPGRSRADFSVRLLWVSMVSGSFEKIHGDVTVARPAGTATVTAQIDLDSIRMESARLRRWVLAPEFFDAEHHPVVHFVSLPLPLATLTQGGDVQGSLTIRGVTRPVSFRMAPNDCTPGAMAGCVLRLEGSIDRTDFEMRGHRGALSDRVNLGLAIVLAAA